MSEFRIITDNDRWGDVRAEIQGRAIKFVAAQHSNDRLLILADVMHTHSALLDSLRYRIKRNMDDKSIILIGAGSICLIENTDQQLRAYWDSGSCKSREGYDRPASIADANEIAEEIANTVQDWLKNIQT